MSNFTTEIKIDAPVDRVWDTLADIGSIDEWNPGVKRSHVTTDRREGLGAGRHCELPGKKHLDETVVDWEPHQRLTMRIVGTNLPLKTADIRFALRPAGGGTIVTVSPTYKLKFGPLGTVLDLLFVRRTYVKGIQALLVGLKKHAEALELEPEV